MRACYSESEPLECESPLQIMDFGGSNICGCPSGGFVDRTVYPPQCVDCLSSCALCND